MGNQIEINDTQLHNSELGVGFFEDYENLNHSDTPLIIKLQQIRDFHRKKEVKTVRLLTQGDFEEVMITIYPNKMIPAYTPDVATQINLNHALMTKYDNDFHFFAYTATPEYRLKVDTTPVDLRFSVFVLDYDRHGEVMDIKSELFVDFIQTQINSLNPPNVIYPTKHGMRTIYILSKPITVKEYSSKYRGFLKQIKSTWYPWASDSENHDFHGLVLDMDTWDWTRLFRLPRVTREYENKLFVKQEFNIPVFFVHNKYLDVNNIDDFVDKKGRKFKRNTPQYVKTKTSRDYFVKALNWVRREAPRSRSDQACLNKLTPELKSKLLAKWALTDFGQRNHTTPRVAGDLVRNRISRDDAELFFEVWFEVNNGFIRSRLDKTLMDDFLMCFDRFNDDKENLVNVVEEIACRLLSVYELSPNDTRVLLREYNSCRCEPQWSQCQLDERLNRAVELTKGEVR